MEEVLDSDLTSDMQNKPIIGKSEAVFTFTKLTPEELTDKFNRFLSKKGYKLESGQSGNGSYGKGNKVLRVLFGAFVKRFQWEVNITPEGNTARLRFFKQSKGYAGGVIGVNQVKNEYNSIVNSIVAFHTKQEIDN